MERKHVKYAFIGSLLIITGIVFALLSHAMAFSVSFSQNQILDENDIYLERFEVIMEDGVYIRGLLYVNEDQKELEDQSVPTILLIHGINGRKENFKDKIFNLLRYGYAVFSVEQRGHGESGGISGFIGKEPHDMISVIDYIEKNHAFADISKLAIYCFSFGGGIGLVLQAFDERVHVAVVHHPLSSLDHIIEQIPFEKYVGRTQAIEDLNAIDDAYEVCTPENTKNLLLIQGSEDTLIDPQDTVGLYHQLNGENRDDIDLEIREGLNHPENEQDLISFKHALVWFEYYYHDPSIDITNRDAEIEKIELIDLVWPESPVPFIFIFFAAIFIFFGLSVILLPIYINPLYYKHYKTYEDVKKNYELDEVEERYDFNKLFDKSVSYNRMILLRSLLYLAPPIVGGLFCYIFNWGILYGYFILIPLASIVLMAFIPSSEHPRWKYEWKHEWDDWYRNHIMVIIISVITILIPIALYIFVFNNNAYMMRTAPIPWLELTTVVYFLIPTSLILADSMLIRGWKFKHTALLGLLRALSMFIFNAFVPIPIFEDYGGIYLTILLLTSLGFATWGTINLFDFIARTYKTRVTAAMITILPGVILFIHSFFRII